jgi:plasmid stabilization system protein ParE
MAHRLAPEAEADLDDIWCYIAKESHSIEIADRVVDSITDRFFLLATYPHVRSLRHPHFTHECGLDWHFLPRK